MESPELPPNLGPVFRTRVPLRGGREAELYVAARAQPDELVAREAVEEFLATAHYQRTYSRRLGDAARMLRWLELEDAARQRVAEILISDELDELDESLFRDFLEALDQGASA